MTKSTITINGRMYDAVTGMPVANIQPAAPARKQSFSDIAPSAAGRQSSAPAAQGNPHPTAPAQSVHKITQKSQTLHRAALKKPVARPAQPAVPARSELIRKFNHNAVAAPAPAKPAVLVAAPTQQTAPVPMHPAAVKAAMQQHPVAAAHVPQLSGSNLKEQLIKERLAEVGNTPAKKQKRGNWLSRQPRLVTILSSTLALLILGGYLTYITLPSISLKVAASRAGVNATMPEYKPDGYSLDGPITYSPGEVIISYKSNTNTTGYKLVQKATNWDSQAVLDNYVGKLTDNYLTYQERGITVYTFGNKAVWVNGGLLYTIDGDAVLSADQVLRLAASI